MRSLYGDKTDNLLINLKENLKQFMMTYPKPIYLRQTVSTNVSLAELCKQSKVKNLTSVYTSFQSDGRGQRGNKWESEDGANLLFSVVIYPNELHARQFFIILQITALAIYEVLSEYADCVSIKWPNDIYWKDKKLCGTLIENDLNGTFIEKSISGSGINLNQTVFLSDAPNPVSLKQITGSDYNPETILHEILAKTEIYVEKLVNGQTDIIKDKYMNALYRKDGMYKYRDKDGEFMARIINIEDDGKFILEDEKGQTRQYLFKEVEYII